MITGTVADIHEPSVVIDVHGVGYHIFTPSATSYSLDTEVKLFTHLAVRETALDLYGFTTRDELGLFELLLGLPKIGPKSAIQIMSQADEELLKTAIRNEDSAYLSKMSGIGKKTAEKIVLGLKDKFEDYTGAHKTGNAEIDGKNNLQTSDAIDALISLGYPQSDARKVVHQLISEKPEINHVNDVVKEALRILGS